MKAIPITKLYPMLERYNGMATPTLVDAAEAPIAPDPLHSDDPKIRAAAREMAAAAKKKKCASRAA